jgi:hypothetical protein
MATGDVAAETAERFRKRTFDDIDAMRDGVANKLFVALSCSILARLERDAKRQCNSAIAE